MGVVYYLNDYRPETFREGVASVLWKYLSPELAEYVLAAEDDQKALTIANSRLSDLCRRERFDDFFDMCLDLAEVMEDYRRFDVAEGYRNLASNKEKLVTGQ